MMNKRLARIEVRVSRREKDGWEALARALGLTLSAFIRRRLGNGGKGKSLTRKSRCL